ncbi:SDR family NAD(P)-dependent oxidoreductase [Sneathiella sp.]|uniref:SDR family NAD(P)-dependent oxidoreductase n=1 Tax=Sneathiella sp. TaxID=1964365 RepID=UPI0026392E3B|nr:SDR family oxidoreductase [Sneathiella sp.]MDF2367125.1 SDR family NAD(P)-dependent oxidoreductase [Sneathiella sp.]
MRSLITGASKGIGRAVALRLAVPGAKLALGASSHSDELQEIVRAVESNGAEALPLVGDLSDPDVPGKIASESIGEFGGLDTVISNAGISIPSAIEGIKVENWDRVFAVNVRAPMLLAQSVHGSLKEAKGAFVAIASMSGVQPYPGMGPYSSSKAALIMFARQLALEWIADGIRVNTISPGLFRTALTEKVYSDEVTKKQREAMVPAGRIGDPAEDLAGVIEFLIQSRSTYMVGQNIVVDGGLIDSIQAKIAGRPATKG